MKRRLPRDIIIAFQSTEDFLPEIRRHVQIACNEAGFQQKISMAMQLAIEEACSNVIRHAYMLGEGIIRLVINIEKDRIIFTIIDNGRAFDFDRDETPDLRKFVETGRKGGFGLYLIQKVMDEVDYGQVEGENHLRMVKYAKRTRKEKKHIPISAKGRLPFRTKFSLAAAASVMLIIGAIFLYLNYRITNDSRNELFTQTLNSLEGLAARLADKMTLNDELQLAALVKNASETLGDNIEFLTVIDTSAIIWADAKNQQLLLTKYNFPEGTDSQTYCEYQAYNDASDRLMHLVLVPIEYLAVRRGIVIAAIPEGIIVSIINKEQKGLIFISLGCLAFAFLIIYLIAHYYVRPVGKLSDSITRIRKTGILDSQINVDGQDEISEIARAFNEMARRFKQHQKMLLERERLKAEMTTARDIQQALLPKRFPDVPGYEIATIYKPTQNVSGDYFDFVKVDDKHLGVVVADVSGKGVPGSLVMTMLRTAIRLEARNKLSPLAVLDRVNSLVCEDVRKGMFITAFYAILDAEKRTAEFVSAGHNPMILYRPSEGDCFLFNPPGIPMGLRLPEHTNFGDRLEAGKLKLHFGDVLVIYTDGITERRNPAGDTFGEDRLVKFIRENSSLHPREFVAKFESELDAFSEGRTHDDDITLVVIKEKTEADAVLYEKKKHLISLVESGEMTIEQACQQEGFSTEAFHKFYRKWKNEGEDGLIEDIVSNSDDGLGLLNYSQSIRIRKIIIEEPELGSEGIYRRLQKSGDGDGIGIKAIHNELRRLRLDDEVRRLSFSLRRGPETVSDPVGILEKDSFSAKKQVEKADLRRKRLKGLIAQYSPSSGVQIPDTLEVSIMEKDRIIDYLQRLKRLFDDVEIVNLTESLIARLVKLEFHESDEIHKLK